MDFFALLQARHSVRKFKADPVSEAQLEKVLDAANRAPSAGNFQAYEIFVVREPAKKSELAAICKHQDFIAAASVVLIFAANPKMSGDYYHERGRDLYCIVDAAVACAYAQLAVADLGLGSCWVGAFDEGKLTTFMRRPDLKPVGVLPIGIPAETPEAEPRRKAKNFVHDM